MHCTCLYSYSFILYGGATTTGKGCMAGVRSESALNPKSLFLDGFCMLALCAARRALSTISYHSRSSSSMSYPPLVVFDLDQCLWTPEMYVLSQLPSSDACKIGPLGSRGVGSGKVGVMSGREVIQLFPDALEILQDIYLDKYPGMRIAAASSADTPLAVKIGRTAMNILEILPGVTMKDVFAKNWEEGFEGNLQIGRTPPLSSDKALTHFPILKQLTGLEYEDMLFFDDCNWGDNCGRVEKKCHGVVTVRTPDGLRHKEWAEGLAKFAATKNT